MYIPTKYSFGIFRGDFRQTGAPRNFLGNAIVAHQAFATARLILLTAKAQRTTKELRRPEQEISSWKILRLRLIVGFEPRGRSSNIDEDEKSWRRRSG
ncbi:hypothetical protein F2Q69_00037026 [Brassica cretica]|uniref:Uncharacterized protein n=1 Tax=Brassica cretica TaxID=69181 RepID=A0A8S9SGW0_BRACR|nr:hypothetical protein F2Q69_00037026 [Brassica cretica]